MTREEAINYLRKIPAIPISDNSAEACQENVNYELALNMAIEALKQEPCDDAISRQTVKEQMIKYGFLAPDMTVTEFVEDLPPVTPTRAEIEPQESELENPFNDSRFGG